MADKHPPVLHPRDRFGRDEDWIDYHPAYREMEKIALRRVRHARHEPSRRRAGLAGPGASAGEIRLHYLFVQAEFGLMCPVSVYRHLQSSSSSASARALKKRCSTGLLSQDPDALLKGTQFMTEKAGGSDVGAASRPSGRIARGDHWKLYGEKWFCSHADADVALLLARRAGAPAGNAGLALFALPRRLEDGSRNSYRIVRLKDKLGTRSMASGEIILDGAVAYLVGDRPRPQADDGAGQPVAAVARRARRRHDAALPQRGAGGRAPPPRLRPHPIDYPLLRRQLMKIMLPTEQALSMSPSRPADGR